MSLLSVCTAEFILQVRQLSAIEATSKRCTSSDKVLLKSSTMKTTKLTKRSQFFTCQSTLTSEITKSCTTSSQTQFSKLLLILQTPRARTRLRRFQILFSCVFQRMFSVSFATCSHKPLKISKEDPLREDIVSCFKRTPTPKLCKKRKTNKTRIPKIQVAKPEVTINLTIEMKMELTMRTNLKISTRMKNQRTSKVKKKT